MKYLNSDTLNMKLYFKYNSCKQLIFNNARVHIAFRRLKMILCYMQDSL